MILLGLGKAFFDLILREDSTIIEGLGNGTRKALNLGMNGTSTLGTGGNRTHATNHSIPRPVELAPSFTTSHVLGG